MLAETKVLKEEANQVLEGTNLLQQLEGIGKVHFTGSYYAGLMLAPDIDVHVESKKFERETAVNLLNEFITKDSFRFYSFRDFVSRPNPDFPRGYYIGLKTDHQDKNWKIDIWLVKKIDPKQQELMDELKAADEQTRLEILGLKQQKLEGKTDLSSTQIYRKILKRE